MARFQPRRYEQIYSQMIARVVGRSRLRDVSDVSVWKHVLAASAREDDEQYYQIALLLQLFSIDKASGEDLDERAKDIQPGVVSRIPAQKAVGSVVFSRAGTTGTTSIPIGTKVKTATGQTFTTTTTGTITPASAEQISGHGVGRDSNTVSVIADVAGADGNVSASAVTRFVSKPPGVEEVTNPAAFTQGADKESDDAFRSRLRAYIRGLSKCTVQAIEAGIIGQVDPITGNTILFAHAVEDIVDRGYVTVYVDDGTGQAEATASEHTLLSAVYTWNGTTTVTTPNTSEVVVGDWIRLVSDGQWFEISAVTLNTSVTILNPGSDTIPSGATASAKATDILTEGFDPNDEAVGGETILNLDNFPIKDSLPINIATDVQGNLVEGVDYTINPVSGQIVLTTPLVAGEQVVGGHTYFTGLLAFAQKVIDGDRNDRENYPGFRAAGTLHQVKSPQILIQPVTAIVTVTEGFDRATVLAAVKQAIKNYINTLTISGDVIRAKLFEKIMRVSGVSNVNIITPTNDVIMLDDQLARTQDANLTIT